MFYKKKIKKSNENKDQQGKCQFKVHSHTPKAPQQGTQ
jgi:hypothetical protein